MQQSPDVILRIEYILFDFARCVNELHALQHELSIVDLEQAERSFKELCNALHEKQRQRNHTLYAVI